MHLSFTALQQRKDKLFPAGDERGNALILILVAVALFAAISYVMTSGSKNSQTSLTEDQARLTASALIQYGDSLRPLVDKMLLMNGLSDTDSPTGSGLLYDPPGAGVAPLTRELFDPTGGNAPYITPPPQACNSTCTFIFSGQFTLSGVGSGVNPDLVMLLVDIPQAVCQQVNNTEGLGTAIPTGTSLGTAGALTTVNFNGTNYGVTPVSFTTSNHTFCYQESGGSNRYIYVNIIRAR